MGDGVNGPELDAMLLADLRRDWGRDYRISCDAGGSWIAAELAGPGVLRAGSAGRLRQLIEGDPESANGHMGLGERALRQLAEDGVI